MAHMVKKNKYFTYSGGQETPPRTGFSYDVFMMLLVNFKKGHNLSRISAPLALAFSKSYGVSKERY